MVLVLGVGIFNLYTLTHANIYRLWIFAEFTELMLFAGVALTIFNLFKINLAKST